MFPSLYCAQSSNEVKTIKMPAHSNILWLLTIFALTLHSGVVWQLGIEQYNVWYSTPQLSGSSKIRTSKLRRINYLIKDVYQFIATLLFEGFLQTSFWQWDGKVFSWLCSFPGIKNLNFDWLNMFLYCCFRKKNDARQMPECPEKKHMSDLKIFTSIFRKLQQINM